LSTGASPTGGSSCANPKDVKRDATAAARSPGSKRAGNYSCAER